MWLPTSQFILDRSNYIPCQMHCATKVDLFYLYIYMIYLSHLSDTSSKNEMKHSASLSTSSGPGRPRKKNKKAGMSRVGNYRTKYRPQDLQKALQAVREKRMAAREAAKKFEVPITTIQDRLFKGTVG
jgi:hypothetical protein